MPPKARRTKEEEKREQEKRELERLENNLVRLTRSHRESEARRKYWEGECQRLGRMVVHTRNTMSQQTTLMEEQREAVARARRALEVSEAGARRIQRELGEGERKTRASEEALEQARVDAEVSTGVFEIFLNMNVAGHARAAQQLPCKGESTHRD